MVKTTGEKPSELPPSNTWRAPAIASAIAAALLLLLLLPGVLRVWIGLPPQQPAQLALPRAEDDRQLKEQIVELERHLAQDVCRLDDGQAPRLTPIPTQRPGAPDSTAPAGRDDPGRTPATPLPDNDGRRADNAGEAPQRYTPPVAPDRAPVPQGAAPQLSQQPSSVAELLERATVLIVTETGIGSGFFVTPTQVLTNAHVIGDSREAWIGNKSFQRMTKASLQAKLYDGRPGGRDFALLKLIDGQGKAHLAISDRLPAKLQNVIATGYPAFVLRTDPAFQRLKQGDISGIPEPSLTQGAVQTVQHSADVSIVVHRASISSGNSGGPLTDECGVLVGVNTFVAAPGEGTDRQFFSQGTSAALAFLQANGVTPQVVANQRCVVGTVGPPRPPAAAANPPAPSAAGTSPPAGPAALSPPAGAAPTPTAPPAANAVVLPPGTNPPANAPPAREPPVGVPAPIPVPTPAPAATQPGITPPLAPTR